MNIETTGTIDFMFNSIHEAAEFRISVLRCFQSNSNKAIRLATILELYGMEKEFIPLSDYGRGWIKAPYISEPEEIKCNKFWIKIGVPTIKIKTI